MRSALEGVRGISYTIGQSYELYPTSGTATDFPYSRHWVDPTKTKALGFLIEWGTEFQPPFSEMENIIRDVSAALVDFAIAAPCHCSTIEIELLTPAINFNAVPEDETAYRAASFSVVSCRDVHLEIVSGPTLLTGPAGTVFGTPAGSRRPCGRPSGSTTVYLAVVHRHRPRRHRHRHSHHPLRRDHRWEIPITAETVERPSVALAWCSTSRATWTGHPLQRR
jgi:hypothetical protein